MIYFKTKFSLSRLRLADQVPSHIHLGPLGFGGQAGGGRIFLHLLFLILVICFFTSSGSAGAVGSGPNYAQIRVTPNMTTVAPGGEVMIYIDQTITSKWHTYWKNPGDSGTPTLVSWELPDGVTVSDLTYPTPMRIPFGPLTNFGYETRAVFTQKLTVPSGFVGDTLTATAKVEWLVCHDICIPERDSVTITVPIAKTSMSNADARDLADIVQKTHPIPVEFDATFYEEDGKFEILATINHPDFFYRAEDASNLVKELNLSKAVFFPTEWGLIDNAAPQETQYDGSEDGKNLSFAILSKRGDRSLADIKEFKMILAVPDGQGTIHGFDMVVRNQNMLGKNDLITPDEKTLTPGHPRFRGDDPAAPDGTVYSDYILTATGYEAIGLAVLGAFIAGLILNLMPCVLPVLFIKILAVAKLSGVERAHARTHGLMYAGGVVVTFLTLAGILVALQVAGAQVGWGFQLQSPVVVVALAALFMGLALNLWGVFDIDLTRFIPAFLQRVEDRTHWNSFLTGILAVFVATPCTVPFMGAAVAYGLTQGPVMTVAIFTAMGLGLSAPFVILTFVPAFMRALPKPGAWMMTFRRVCAVPMALTALWLASVFVVQTGVMFPSLWAQHQNESVISYTPSALDQALKTDRPVFVNMTAAWCITCKYNERVALNTDQTRAMFDEHNVQMVVGDWTNYNADITTYLNQFDRKGVPIYVFYDRPDPRTGVRPDPVLLPSLLNEKILYDLFIHEIGEKK